MTLWKSSMSFLRWLADIRSGLPSGLESQGHTKEEILWGFKLKIRSHGKFLGEKVWYLMDMEKARIKERERKGADVDNDPVLLVVNGGAAQRCDSASRTGCTFFQADFMPGLLRLSPSQEICEINLGLLYGLYPLLFYPLLLVVSRSLPPNSPQNTFPRGKTAYPRPPL